MNDQHPPEAWPPRPTLPPAQSQMPSPQFGSPPPPPPPMSAGPVQTPWPVSPGSTPIPNPIQQHAPVYASQTNLGLGIVYGLIAAVLGGAIWYGIVVVSNRQFIYLAIGFGVLVGAGVVKGAKRANAATAIAAALIAAIGIVASYYFIYRHAVIETLADRGYSDVKVPLFGDLQQVTDFIRYSFDEQKSQYLFSLVAVGVAGFVGAKNR
ncbi:MAG: hypothetical protein ABIR32_21200 [Ilumatobacteraceae bacterium]